MAFSYNPPPSTGYGSQAYGYGSYYPSTQPSPQVFEGYQPINPRYESLSGSHQHVYPTSNGSSFNSEPPPKRLRLTKEPNNSLITSERQSSSTLPPLNLALTQQTPQATPQHLREQQLPTSLEQQVRGLAHFDQTPVPPNPLSAEHGATHVPTSTDLSEVQFAPSGRVLPQRGAAPGNILNLSCANCSKKKRKCTKDFPCKECRHEGVDCVPTKRRYRQPNGDGAQQEELGDTEQLDGDASHTLQTNARSRSIGDPERKFYSHLVPVVGSHQEWSNKRTKI
jgi:hypothetical protein